MPNKANAKKALRQSEKRAQRNKVAKAEIHPLRVSFRKSITAVELPAATELAKTISKKLDKLVSRGIMKKNTVARYKSRIAAKLAESKK